MEKHRKLIEDFDILYQKAKTDNNHYLFLENGIFLIDDKKSDARFPYVESGMVLWAHNNGKVHLSESDFFFIPETVEGETSFLSYYLGIKDGDEYRPYSLFSFDRNVFEKGVKRATVFSYYKVTYILEKDDVYFLLDMTLNKDKELLMNGEIINNSSTDKDIYSSLYFNPMLMHGNYSSVETKWFKKCEYSNDAFYFDTTEDISRTEHLYHHYVLTRNTSENVLSKDNTTSRGIYCQSKTGDKNSSPCLLTGHFDEEKNVTCFSDTAIAGDYLHAVLKAGERMCFSYALSKDKSMLSLNDIQSYFDYLKEDEPLYEMFSFESGKEIDADKLTSFSKMLVKQVDYCASTKNSTLKMLGFRDIFQALEAATIFKPHMVREKILECLDYVSINGRCPRQFAWSFGDDVRIDAREFIDQGIWVIDCIYQYLSFTGDFSLLKEERRYIEINPDNSAKFSNRKDDVLHHLKQILVYLIDNIDSDTGCLKTLYGDWNDAIDGLGKSKDGKGFGNGVSIMATFQLYSCLNKAISIFEKVNFDMSWINEMEEAKNILNEGLLKNAFQKKGNETKILHGWGNERSFYVGSFNDIDHKERDTLTSNAFYVLSGFYKEHPEYKGDVLKAYHKLEGKYGFKTFEPYFDKDAYEVGRIVNLPKGTAENAATYIHGSVFAVDSLFVLDEPKYAWKQLFKLLPITHDYISTTPFVMPNSYVYNPELGCDGESMNDWFTGSSSTVFKSLVRNIFGFDPNLDYISLHPASYFPFIKASLTLSYQGKKITLIHYQTNKGRQIRLNGTLLDEDKLSISDLIENNEIIIED